MLELKGITKIYPAGGENVHALKGIDLRFRESEFVAILGPSGCGKTTMLNIIGGLDQYTDGDLIINGTSTKTYKDRDWDAYRNHSIGFVFQSYNLIPHQTVLQNVELALTLSGVSKKERRIRAKEALKMVGLTSQLNKHPSQMSGGQMQRVAIARAIVNNPDIVLADEPTGALDTETSLQVMEILKEISKDRLVIMVTHNPDLAEQYATRTVRMLDGEIKADSMPLTEEETHVTKEEPAKHGKEKTKKPSMSFFTSFGLSLKNLFSKKGRTALTSFAGSIGIIGIALIYAVSQGTTNYIDFVQEQTLSSYPLSIQAQTMDISTLLSTFMGRAESIEEHENDAIYQKAMLYELLNSFNSVEAQENDLKAFASFIEQQRADETSPLHEALSAVQYSYDVDLIFYTKNVDGKIIRSDTSELVSSIMKTFWGVDFMNETAMSTYSAFNSSSMMSSRSTALWNELRPGNNGEIINSTVKDSCELLYGNWPTNYNEVVLFVDERNELADLVLYALGLIPEKNINELAKAALDKKIIDYDLQHWSYEELCNMDFRTVLNADCYSYDEETGLYTDLRGTDAGLQYLYDNALHLKVTGIVKPSADALSESASSGIGYTSLLTQYIIEHAKNSPAAQAQEQNPDTDIFTGLPFPAQDSMTEAEKAEGFRAAVAKMKPSEKAELYVSMMSSPSDEDVSARVDATISAMSRADMESTLLAAMKGQVTMDEATVQAYLKGMSDEELTSMFKKMLTEQMTQQIAEQTAAQYAAMSEEQLASAMDNAVAILPDETAASLYDSELKFSSSSYQQNLIRLGRVDLDTPSTINLYANTFANKDMIEDEIERYNDSVDELQKIKYTDIVGFIMSSVTTIINAITYVLIAFVSVSLIVSSIMIGVITLISVQERTKEIGILRAIGASKKNVSSMFNAETVIIGFTSGLLGILITYLLCIPINLILHKLTGINNLSATLPIPTAIILIVISMLLTLVSGIIPSRSAAKKDPVVALRTE